MIVHELRVSVRNEGKSGLHYCEVCNSHTLHTRGLYMFPFRCVANHGGMSRCHGCHAFVADVVKVVVTGQWDYELYCSLCCEPDSPQKEEKVAQRRQKAAEEARKPVDLNDPSSIGRALGASGFWRR